MTSLKSLRLALLVGAAIAVAPGPLLAQQARPPASQAELEARIKALEEALSAVRADLSAAKASSDAHLPQLETLKKETVEVSKKADEAAKREGFKVGDATVKLGGFFKAEALVTDFTNGDGGNRDFYNPGTTPVGPATADEDVRLDAHLKQSRFWLTVSRTVGDHKIGGYLETDFQSSPGAGTEAVTNAYNLALRRAYLTVDNWLIGQEWTTFMNVATLPETTDFIGTTDGTPFARQAMVRYTAKLGEKTSLVLAAENPETVLANGGMQDDDVVPDFIAKLAFKAGKADLTLAGIGRQLSVQQGTALSEDALGWGVSFAGKAPFGKNDLRFSITHGEGIGRYMGLGFASDAVLVNTAARRELEPIALTAATVAGRFVLTDKTRVNLMASAQEVDNDPAITAAAANESAWSAAANVFHSPVKGLDLGVEFRHGERETRNGANGEINRLHLVAKQTF